MFQSLVFIREIEVTHIISSIFFISNTLRAQTSELTTLLVLGGDFVSKDFLWPTCCKMYAMKLGFSADEKCKWGETHDSEHLLICPKMKRTCTCFSKWQSNVWCWILGPKYLTFRYLTNVYVFYIICDYELEMLSSGPRSYQEPFLK